MKTLLEIRSICERVIALDKAVTPGPWLAEIGMVPALRCRALSVIKGKHPMGGKEEAICVVSKADKTHDLDRANADMIVMSRTVLAQFARATLAQIDNAEKWRKEVDERTGPMLATHRTTIQRADESDRAIREAFL